MPPHIGRLRSTQNVTKVEATPSGVDQRVNPPTFKAGFMTDMRLNQICLLKTSLLIIP